MVYRALAAVSALVLSLGLAHARDTKAPKAEPGPSASTIDPMDVPRGMHDWFAKAVDDILTDDEPGTDEKPQKRR